MRSFSHFYIYTKHQVSPRAVVHSCFQREILISFAISYPQAKMGINVHDPLVQLKSMLYPIALTLFFESFAVTSVVCSTFAVAATIYRLIIRRGRIWADDVGNGIFSSGLLSTPATGLCAVLHARSFGSSRFRIHACS